MRTVIISMIGISSIIFVVMIQTTINQQNFAQNELEDSLSTALSQTMSEVMEQDSYGIDNRNEMVAAFLQAMIIKMNTDMDLTVKIHQVDMVNGQMDVEAIGEIILPNQRTKKVCVRRRIGLKT